MEGAGPILIEGGIQSLLTTVQTDHNHKILPSGYLPCRPKFESATQPTQIWTVARYSSETNKCMLSVWMYIINTVYLLHVLATHVAILREMSYTEWVHWEITNVRELMNRCKILSSKDTCFKLHNTYYNKDNMFLLILVGNVSIKINKSFYRYFKI